jgi:hypothetical protein
MSRRNWSGPLIGGVLMATGACSSTAPLGRDAGADARTSLPACTWPASLDPVADGAVGRCVAARAYLSCTSASGAGEACLSDDPAQCPASAGSPVAVETFSGCQDQCHADEYAVGCGGAGPGPWPPPPTGCRAGPIGPGGGTISCCPCAPSSPPDAGDAPTASDSDGGRFSCGLGATCDARSEVCEHVSGGAPPGADFFACIPLPAACADDLSCACVTNQLRGRGAGACAATGGGLTVDIAVP